MRNIHTLLALALSLALTSLFALPAFPQKIEQPRRVSPQPQCVEIWTVDRTGSSGGSGTFISSLMVVTANHVVADRKTNETSVHFPNGEVIAGIVAGVDKRRDFAIVKLARNPQGVKPIECTTILTVGSPLSSNGYGSKEQKYRQSWGVLTSAQFLSGCRKVRGAHSRSGDSGGPVIDEHGRFVGPLWGCIDNETYFVPYAIVLKFIKDRDLFEPLPVRPAPYTPYVFGDSYE